MPSLSLLLLVMQASPAPAPAPAPVPAQDAASRNPIVVSGIPERVGGRRVEQPYTEGEHVMLGSRVPRRRDARGFRTVATDSGLAGLMQGNLQGFDGTGGSAPRMANRPVIECIAGHSQVLERTACILFRARQAIARQEHDAAAAAIAPLLRNRALSGIERYYVANINLELAEATEDGARREAAIAMMVESGRMPAADRPNAMRILAQLATRRGDNGAAVARLERLVAEMPDEPRNHADLAWLHSRSGRDADAIPRMMHAVELARRAGGAVPQAWTDFLNADP